MSLVVGSADERTASTARRYPRRQSLTPAHPDSQRTGDCRRPAPAATKPPKTSAVHVASRRLKRFNGDRSTGARLRQTGPLQPRAIAQVDPPSEVEVAERRSHSSGSDWRCSRAFFRDVGRVVDEVGVAVTLNPQSKRPARRERRGVEPAPSRRDQRRSRRACSGSDAPAIEDRDTGLGHVMPASNETYSAPSSWGRPGVV